MAGWRIPLYFSLSMIPPNNDSFLAPLDLSLARAIRLSACCSPLRTQQPVNLQKSKPYGRACLSILFYIRLSHLYHHQQGSFSLHCTASKITDRCGCLFLCSFASSLFSNQKILGVFISSLSLGGPCGENGAPLLMSEKTQQQQQP
jgi:hypothetical protein